MVGRITKAEVGVILENGTRPDNCVNLGSLLAETGRAAGGFERPVESAVRNTEPVSFE